ncbi:MarR family winged helix-turn-helix transcriptional regulator [Streptomyces sp. NPDC088747]|uniref:MarR family winged helix-turn-helix transcriptional regulator n=1 Tax=Streptomyces sp. NPDC088747 TaxID=3365886 RepID=UPI003804DE68
MSADERQGLGADQLAAYYTLMEVGSLLEQAVAQHLREDGDLSPVQAQILAVLGDTSEDGLRMTDIADRIVYSRSGFSYQAGKLEQRGLITRAPAADDERSTLLSLTAEGRDLLRRVRPGHVELVRMLVFEAMPDADVQALRNVLEPVRDRLRQDPPRSARAQARRNTRD